MTALQARLLAGRAVKAARAQEEFARRLRPAAVAAIPTQRSTADAPKPAVAPASG